MTVISMKNLHHVGKLDKKLLLEIAITIKSFVNRKL